MRALMKVPLLSLLLMASLSANAARELSWDALIPVGTSEQFGMPAAMHDLSQLADVLSENADTGGTSSSIMDQQQPQAPTVTELDGQEVKLPGYIVPLTLTDENRVTEFLLVPYFGACIHVPPPPSNQIVLVQSKEGIALDAAYVPFWITGTLHVEQSESELASAGYRLSASKIEVFEY
ncbi:hypothetical protein LCGC14_0419170 [marine sediment metagenome]|uniref:Lipoprotein n=1 Tax=marine sediment metagenome TaxID=412755 RepID=A0A0F9W0J1_9ZZZZ